jgi:hypothetical protein
MRSQTTRSSTSRLKAGILWVIPAIVIASPLAWWLLQIQPQQVHFKASCEEIKLSSESPIVSTILAVSQLELFGVVAKIENVGSSRIKDTKSGQSLSAVTGPIELQDSKNLNPPAVSVNASRRVGPFIAAFTHSVAIKRLPNDGTNAVLEYKPEDVAISFQAEELLITADRMNVPGLSANDFSISVRNQTLMTKLSILHAPGRTSIVQATFPQSAPIKLTFQANTQTKTRFAACDKFEGSADGEKLDVPTIARDLEGKFGDLRVDSIAADSSYPKELRIDGGGLSTSLTYDDRQLIGTNLGRLLSLTVEKQGLIGLIAIMIFWLGKEIAERLGKRVLDRLLPEEKK